MRTPAERASSRGTHLPVATSYMGTKRHLSEDVQSIIQAAPEGPLLDLFCGICAVAQASSNERQIWCNDTQSFAHLVASVCFSHQYPQVSLEYAIDVVQHTFNLHFNALSTLFSDDLSLENQLISSYPIDDERVAEKVILQIRSKNKNHNYICPIPHLDYHLFTSAYRFTYYSTKQCMTIDALRKAIDISLEMNNISCEQRDFLLLALCQAMSKCSNSTGHFAQFLKPNERNINRYLRQWSRSIWTEWLNAINTISPVRSSKWRKQNQTHNKDALTLLTDLAQSSDRPAVIYADPPYTGDQYSRYYHLYETFLKYDYPTLSGKGLYRSDRYISLFSHKKHAEGQFVKLAQLASDCRSALVLSYPNNGVISTPRERIPKILKEYFKTVEVVKELSHRHSSLGASKGVANHKVTELLFWAT